MASGSVAAAPQRQAQNPKWTNQFPITIFPVDAAPHRTGGLSIG